MARCGTAWTGIARLGMERQGKEIMITFFVPGNPQALKRHRSTKRGIMYDPSKNDKADFLAMCMANRPEEPLTCALEVDIIFNMARPKKHYRTNGQVKDRYKEARHTIKPDRDNLVKFVHDALEGVFWKNDSQIDAGTTVKRYSEKPGVSITIHI